LTFEASGFALTNSGGACKQLSATPVTASHSGKAQRWIIHETAEDSRLYTIKSAVDGRFIGSKLNLVENTQAVIYNITYFGGGKGYELLDAEGKYITVDSKGNVVLAGASQGFRSTALRSRMRKH
jgi:hypothetical protein